MIEKVVNGKKQLCYLVHEGPAADIVIPVAGLLPIDRQRLDALVKQANGADLMTVMRNTRLDNKRLAIFIYQNMFRTIMKEVEVEVEVEPVDEQAGDEKKEGPRTGRPAVRRPRAEEQKEES